MIKELIDWFMKHLKLSEEDAIIAAMSATAGFTIDALAFPAGMPPGTVTTLSGIGGLVGSRWVRNRSFYQKWLLNRIDRLVREGHLDQAEGASMKKRLIDKWFGSVGG